MAGLGYLSFCDFVRGQRISLVGAGVSNLPLVPFLTSCGAKEVTLRDSKKKINDAEIQSAIRDGAVPILGDAYLSDLNEDIIIRSPGIRPDIPPFLKAVDNGAYLTCETELFLRFAPCKTIAVTGSDGKTTTTTLISKILEAAGYPVFLGGNIGRAMLPQLKEISSPSTVSVMELSSFQLMNCRYSPNVSVITNLSENHLNWHLDMAEYLEAKKNILLHQASQDLAVLNFDNAYTKACRANGNKRFFSYDAASLLSETQPTQDAVYFENGTIYFRKMGSVSTYLDAGRILLPGKHNVENYMAAIAATADLVSPQDTLQVAESFTGVEHRIELCRELDGVKYYNSSIDSSPARSTAALRSFPQKVIMIAGGYDKHLDYTPLGDEICQHVKTLILCGATAEKIKTAVISSPLYREGCPKIIDCPDFSQTARVAREEAVNGDQVILSPASASFDLFRNFEERGKLFKKLVSEL